MKLAETVTFGGSGLDRAAALRGTARATPHEQSRTIVLWRGKCRCICIAIRFTSFVFGSGS